MEDDMTQVIEAVRNTDILVIAAPIYYHYIPGPLKSFIDRTWVYFKPDFGTNPVPSYLDPGKKLVFIQTQGDTNENIHKDVYEKIESFFKLYGFDTRTILACGVNELGEVSKCDDIMDLAEKTARELMAA